MVRSYVRDGMPIMLDDTEALDDPNWMVEPMYRVVCTPCHTKDDRWCIIGDRW